MSIGFSLVGLDRFMILPMFPAIQKDLNLGYQELGHIAGALSIAWGISGFVTGRMTDRIGPRKVVVGSIIAFSVLVGVSGLAGGLMSLPVIRALMGLADGAHTPPSIVATLEASAPHRCGLNLGLQQAMLPLFGLARAPIHVTQLLDFVDGRWIFLLVTPPGLLVAFLLYRVLRDPDLPNRDNPAGSQGDADHKWTDALAFHNVRLNMIGQLCGLTYLIVTRALLPSYLTDDLHLDVPSMGFVLPGIGFGACVGTVAMPWVSDRLGRRPVMLLSTAGGFGSLIVFASLGAQPGPLFLAPFATHFFNFACLTLTVGPLSSGSVPNGLAGTATGLAIALGELFGGGVAPVLAGFINALFLIETAPGKAVKIRRKDPGVA